MADDRQAQKRAEQAEYRAKLIEAELNAVRSSKAYQLSKKMGIVSAQLRSNPVGLTKKAARMLLKNPKKLRHILRSANRGAMMVQAVAEQTAKYQEWILLNELDEHELDEQRTASEKLSYRPLVSIVTPVFNPPVDVLEELIESVLEQTYGNFELCLGDFGDSEQVAQLIKRYAELDKRVKYYPFSENLGIAGNSNQILEKVNGEFIALLDHDDTISPNALYENIVLLNDKPYDFIYSDKDKIDEKGNRFDPLFKPKLSPEMLLNINYLTHLNIMRTSLVRKVGAWNSDTDGAQDWDLFLKVVAGSKHVGHIPKVLYHWRVIASSTAMSIETKPYALAGQRKAVDKYLASQDIPATSYHKSTELFLKWDKKALDQRPLVFLYYSNGANLMRSVRTIKKTIPADIVVLLQDDNKKQAADINKWSSYPVLAYGKENLASTILKYCADHLEGSEDRTVICMFDNLRFPSHGATWYEDLTGWLSIKDVGAASGRLVDRHDLIVDSGGIIAAGNTYTPIFKGFPRFYQSYIGNAEWVRNLNIVSASLCATKLSLLQEYANKSKGTEGSMEDYFLWLVSQDRRLVLTPHVTASIYEDPGINEVHRLKVPKKLAAKLSAADPFGSVNLSHQDPMRLFADEVLIGQTDMNGVEVLQNTVIDTYQRDATILADTFDITERELAANKKIIDQKTAIDAKSVSWFLPSFDAIYAGLINIFSFANYLATEEKVAVTIFILKATNDVSKERELVLAKFPELKRAKFIAIRPDNVSSVPDADVGIATQWATAYPLAKSQNIRRKCYFIQDNEANFYPKGSISSLVELTYRFGFTAIANTEGLLDMYFRTYGGHGVVTKSRVDLTAYHPREDIYYVPKKPYKVFFYARPNMPRNAFELGIAALKRLKQKLGDDIEIITAGATWDPEQYGVGGLFTNLGMIAYEAVPKLYRSVDAGLMFMFSGHPGVTASELMASGCPVVVNEYDDVTWHELYQHEKTCLVSKPTASEVARNLERCLIDDKLRKKLIDGGIEKTQHFYDGYEGSLKLAWERIKNGKA